MVGVNIMRYTIELCKVGIVEAGILRVAKKKGIFPLFNQYISGFNNNNGWLGSVFGNLFFNSINTGIEHEDM